MHKYSRKWQFAGSKHGAAISLMEQIWKEKIVMKINLKVRWTTTDFFSN